MDKCFIKYPELKNNNSLNSNNKSKDNKTYKKNSKKSKVIFKKKQSTKAIISALLNNKLINKEINPLKITKNILYSKEELKFLDIIKERVIKKAKDYSKSLYKENSLNKGLILDSGASEHYTPYKDYLLDYKPISNKSVIIANGVRLPIKGIGHIPIIIN